jgi:predicted dithiol-disulfide oxidoreductase (DUF899 family)
MELSHPVSAAEWQAAVDDIRANEKAGARRGDPLAADRRRLSMVSIEEVVR